jgi:DNA-binding PadR family transcriptional regulator
VQRFERTFGEALELSSPSQIYTALDTLVRRLLIEIMPAEELDGAPGRQPKPHYRATAEGARDYEQWLISQLREERRRSRMFAQQLAMLAPRAALWVLDRCEQACLKEASRTTPTSATLDGSYGLTARLITEEDRLAVGTRLTWIEYARRELKALLSGHSSGR